ncbi:MAG TPA: hypothetical protein VD948_13020 [Rhodothermales bacterium]|nr:hypothetical protein [Rhodothermales bacterium]
MRDYVSEEEIVRNTLDQGEVQTQFIESLITGPLTSLNLLTAANQRFGNGANITVTSAGDTHTIAFSGILPVAAGGSGTGTAFTQGSVVFAGASGTYSQDNASFFFDDTNNRLRVTGIEHPATSPAQITADQNNYDPGAGYFFRLSSDASRNITGIAGGANGRKILLVNVGSNDIVLTNEDGASTAANRVITGTGASVTLAANDTAELIYDSTTARWRLLYEV